MRSDPNTRAENLQRQQSVARQLREYVSREDVIDLCADVLANVVMLPDTELMPMEGGAHGSRVFHRNQNVCYVRCQNTSPQRAASVVVGDDSGVWIFTDSGDAVAHIADLMNR